MLRWINLPDMNVKTLFCSIALFVSCIGAQAQVYLVDRYKPTESSRYKAFTSSSGEKLDIASKMIGSGFALNTGKNGLVAEDNPGYVVFHLKGAYSKISFIIGPRGSSQSYNSFDDNVIVTIKADGKRIFDEVIQAWHAPREVVLDINGVDELRIDLPRGATDLAFGRVKLWKASETYKPSFSQTLPQGKLNLPDGLKPYLLPNNGTICTIGETKLQNAKNVSGATVNRHKFTSGMMFATNQQLAGKFCAYTYFWIDRQYDKLSFVVGAQDSKSSKASGWLSVMADGKIIYEKLVKQGDLAERVVLDIAGVNVLSFHSELRDCAFLGGMNIVVAEIAAYRKGDKTVPAAGELDYTAQRLSKLPDVAPMCSNMKPYSYGGVADFSSLYFSGESSHYTFSMGGEKFYEGFVLATGNNLFGDNINSYVSFDMGGQYDYISFKAGSLSKKNVLDDDYLQVYADDELVLDARIYSTWPAVYFEVPIKKCRKLTFAKPGTGKDKQIHIGIGDVVMYRGKPVENDIFYHEKPECPAEADLIDLFGKPYLHYVGRYLSDLTNFSIEDCFVDGSTQKRYFQMPDGSKIYKGIMLETNIPLGLENVNLTDAVYMFFLGAGSAISSSAVSAATGITAGVSGVAAGMSTMKLMNSEGGQSSVAAYNLFGEYQSLTFTVACKSPYVDPFDEIFNGAKNGRPVTFDVFADLQLVGKFELSDDMQPKTFTVPLYGANQLMFWLECGDVRSGQYVLYDLKLSKTPCLEKPVFTSGQAADAGMDVQSGSYKVENALESAERQKQEEARARKEAKKAAQKSKAKKSAEPEVWDLSKYSGDSSVDDFLRDVSNVWKDCEKLKSWKSTPYTLVQDWVQAADGSVFKCVSFVDAGGNRLSTTDMQQNITELIQLCKDLKFNANLAKVGLPVATLGVATLPNLESISYFGKYVKKGNTILNQCIKDADIILDAKNAELEVIHNFIQNAVNVGNFKSTARVMILVPSKGEKAPAVMQRLEYYKF